MIRLYTPKFEDLRFRQMLLSDPETMSYNIKWGGTIDFPKESRQGWYDRWIVNCGNKRFYRFLYKEEYRTDDYIMLKKLLSE